MSIRGHADAGVRAGRAHLRAPVLDADSCACGRSGAARCRPTRSRSGSRTGRRALTQIGNAYHNQLETPLLFYVLILLALITKTADSILFVLSWLFVGSRFVHAYIHLTSNRLDRRAAGVPGRRHRPRADVDHRRRAPHHRRRRMTPGARGERRHRGACRYRARKRPASEALKDWGLAHRFAGSGDRAAIGNLVFDALRHRASNAYAMAGRQPARARAAHPRFGLGG